MIQDLETKRWIQIGTVQGAVGACGEIEFPGIYVRLDDPAVSSFIESVVDPPKKEGKGKALNVLVPNQAKSLNKQLIIFLALPM